MKPGLGLAWFGVWLVCCFLGFCVGRVFFSRVFAVWVFLTDFDKFLPFDSFFFRLSSSNFRKSLHKSLSRPHKFFSRNLPPLLQCFLVKLPPRMAFFLSFFFFFFLFFSFFFFHRDFFYLSPFFEMLSRLQVRDRSLQL